MNISVCMIVKNEEIVLERSLQSVSQYDNEIIVIDTGSTDQTKTMAQNFTDKVYDYVWHNDFAAARNFSIEKATNDWVLVLDADEVVTSFNSAQLQNIINRKEACVGRIEIVNILSDSTGEKRYVERVSRLFNRKFFHYEGIIHEQIVHLKGLPFDRIPVNISVEHMGYTSDVLKRTNKVHRNIGFLELASKQNPDELYLPNYNMGVIFECLGDIVRAKLYYKQCGQYPLALNRLALINNQR